MVEFKKNNLGYVKIIVYRGNVERGKEEIFIYSDFYVLLGIYTFKFGTGIKWKNII